MSKLHQLIRIVEKKGISYLLKKALYKHVFPLMIKRKRVGSFAFNGKDFAYFYNDYNIAHANERTVEVPIVYDYLKNAQTMGKRILEVGNVLGHYFDCQWDVLDLYENAEGVINKDVVDYSPSNKYDLILSISTLEHVGYDEEKKDDGKVIDAINNLKTNCLNKGGMMIVTWGLNYNTNIDALLYAEKLGFNSMGFLERISWGNKWKQTTLDKARLRKYDKPFLGANSVVVAIYQDLCEYLESI